MATAVRQPRLNMAGIVILIRDFSHRRTDQLGRLINKLPAALDQSVPCVQYTTVRHPYPEPLPRTSEPTFPIRVGRQIAGRLICSWGPCRITRRIFLANQPAHLSEICPYHARQSQKAAANSYSKIQASFSKPDQVTRGPPLWSRHNRHGVLEGRRLPHPARCVTV